MNSEASRKRGGFVISGVAVLAPPWRKEVGDAYAVVNYFTVYEHPLVIRFLSAHELLD